MAAASTAAAAATAEDVAGTRELTMVHYWPRRFAGHEGCSPVVTRQVLDMIGAQRLDVWRSALAPHLRDSSCGGWYDQLDEVAMAEDGDDGPSVHFFCIHDANNGALLASSRLSIHASLADPYALDGPLYLRHAREVPVPFASLSRLVVSADARGRGCASRLNQARVAAAFSQRLGACESIIVTASADNARLLARIGFVDTGLTHIFDNRPGVLFHAMELLRPRDAADHPGDGGSVGGHGDGDGDIASTTTASAAVAPDAPG